jgi:hypothetical protein
MSPYCTENRDAGLKPSSGTLHSKKQIDEAPEPPPDLPEDCKTLWAEKKKKGHIS